MIMDADGSNPRPLTDGCECKNGTWAPDGTAIVFEKSRTTKDGPFAIFIMYLDRPEESSWVMVTDYKINGRSPVWQP